jgi:hypothetical protein
MGVLPVRDSGFLDGLRRSPSKDPSPNRYLRSCRVGISRHRSMGGSESSGKAPRPCGLRGFLARICSIGNFHRFKRPPDDRRHGLELMVPHYEYVCCGSRCLCTFHVIRVCVLRPTYGQPACISLPRLTATSGLDWTQASYLSCFQSD